MDKAFSLRMPETLEAEIIEIDGKPPVDDASGDQGRGRQWPDMGPRWSVRFDKRWWPLWILLGMVAVAFAVIVGLIAGTLYLIWAVLRAIGRVFGMGGRAV